MRLQALERGRRCRAELLQERERALAMSTRGVSEVSALLRSKSKGRSVARLVGSRRRRSASVAGKRRRREMHGACSKPSWMPHTRPFGPIIYYSQIYARTCIRTYLIVMNNHEYDIL